MPATAIVHASYGDSVFVIEDKKPGSPGMARRPTASRSRSRASSSCASGAARGDFVAITKGVKAGQEVVSAGAFKLRNNAPIVVDNTRAGRSRSSRRTPRTADAMKLTDLFIRRPVLAIVVNLVIIIAGLQAIRTLNVRQYPKLESATVTVRTVYVGASADLVRGFITTPLERAIAAADGIDYIESQSVQGLSTINVRLEAQLQRRRRAGRHQRARQPGARRSAARGRGAGDQHRAVRRADRGDVPELQLRRPRRTTRSPTT